MWKVIAGSIGARLMLELWPSGDGEDCKNNLREGRAR
jgi:hypothetical protein